MRHFNLLLLCTLLSLSMFAQNLPSDTVFIEQYFVPGKTYSYEIKRAKYDSRKPEYDSMYISIPVSFTIHNTKKGVLYGQWKYGKQVVKGTDLDVSSLDDDWQKMFSVAEGTMLELELDYSGAFMQLRNYDDCVAMLKKQMKNILDNPHTTDMSEQQKKQLIEMMSTSYDTPEKLIETYFQDVVMYFGILGQGYIKDTVFTSDYTVTNPFGGEPFPMHGEVVYDKIEEPHIYVHSTESIPSEDLMRILTATFKSIAQRNGKTFNFEDVPDFDLVTKVEYKYDYVNKKLLYATSKKLVRSESIQQTHIIEVHLIK